MVQMHLTVPHQQKGPAMSSLRFTLGQALSEAKDLSAERDRPFASLRVTWCDGSNCHVRFVQIEPCLRMLGLATLLLAGCLTDLVYEGLEQHNIKKARDEASRQQVPRRTCHQVIFCRGWLMPGERIL